MHLIQRSKRDIPRGVVHYSLQLLNLLRCEAVQRQLHCPFCAGFYARQKSFEQMQYGEVWEEIYERVYTRSKKIEVDVCHNGLLLCLQHIVQCSIATCHNLPYPAAGSLSALALAPLQTTQVRLDAHHCICGVYFSRFWVEIVRHALPVPNCAIDPPHHPIVE